MKKQFTKKCGAIIACSALIGAALAGGVAGLSGITASAEEGDASASTPKIFYYVDAGNMATDAEGTTEYSGRNGDTKYPAKYKTNFMKAYGLEFGTKTGEVVSGLYNSSLDNEYGVDPATGKSWGLNTAGETIGTQASWRWWGIGHTDSGATLYDGYKTSRCVNEGNYGDGALVYKFEVDDATTALKVTIGTRKISTWGDAPEGTTVRINGLSAENLPANGTDQKFEFNTGITGVEDDGKNFVTLTIGENNKCAMISWIMVTTADYKLYNLPEFVQKDATTVTLTADDNSTVQGTLTQESQTALAAANMLDRVEVTATFENGRSVTNNVSVQPDPTKTKYFVNLGDTTDSAKTYGGIMIKDGAYSEETGYGWTTGTVNNNKTFPGNGAYYSAGQSYIESCRVDITSINYQFDNLHAGTYDVIVGVTEYWEQYANNGRVHKVKANDGTEASTAAPNSGNNYSGTWSGYATKAACEGTVGENGTLTVNIAAVGDECVIAYILVYEKELSTDTHNLPDYSDITWNWTGTESATATVPCECGVAGANITQNATVTSATTKEATCLEKGEITYTATITVNDVPYTNDCATKGEIALAEHTYGDLVAGTPATCLAAGEKAHYTCSVCNKNFDEAKENEIDNLVIAQLSHSGEKTEAQAATCTEPGNIAYWTCENGCGKKYADNDGAFGDVLTDEEITVAATGHSASNDVVWGAWTDEFTCTYSGTCSVCGETLSAAAATITSVVTTEPTCTEKGVKTYTAKAGDETNPMTKTQEIDALGHDYDYEHITWNWNNYECTTATVACKNDATHTDTLTVTVTSEVTTEATAEADGEKTYTATATVGGETYTDTKTEKIDKLTSSDQPGDQPGEETPGTKPNDKDDEKDGLSMGAIAGIVIGVAAVVGAGAGVGVYFLKRKKK